MLRFKDIVVIAAVNLNDQLFFTTGEVDNEGRDGELATKL